MRKKILLYALVIILCLVSLGSVMGVRAEDSTKDEVRGDKNSTTGYETVIIDSADLLSDGEEKSLLEDMTPITEYGNAVFYTVDTNYGQTSYTAREKFNQLYGSNRVSGTLFIIDMANREIYIYNSGQLSYTMTSSKSNTITDNVYRQASAGNYYRCASETFQQINTVLSGGRIAEPMKITSNIFLALIIGMLIAYSLVRVSSTVAKPSEKELLAAIQLRQSLNNYNKVFTHQTRRYDPPSSSGGGGGGGGGGGHSSGGGHSF